MSDLKKDTLTAEQHLVQDLRRDLHDLCQPLASLQCRLELGRMAGDAQGLTEAVRDGLTEMERVLHHIATMRQRLADTE